ncbi:Tat pathway signal protein [Actinomyces gaoshouyii]|nr:Tat pathway signal protein [Actinomyces gaoshouyii]
MNDTARPRSPRFSPQPARALPSRRSALVRMGAAVLGTAAMAGAAACEVPVGSSDPDPLPTMTGDEASREALARRAALIGSTARAVIAQGGRGSTSAQAEVIAQEADTQLAALGGVWEPWPTGAPTGYPTATPVETAAGTATSEDLVAALGDGAASARSALESAQAEELARLVVSLHIAWSLREEALSPGSVATSARSASTTTSPLPDTTLALYDQLRYTGELLAAQSASDSTARRRAVEDAAAATAVVNASIAAKGPATAQPSDPRQPAYGAPAGADSADSPSGQWMGALWRSIMVEEMSIAVSGSGEQRLVSADASVAAALRAISWGVETAEALPGTAG